MEILEFRDYEFPLLMFMNLTWDWNANEIKNMEQKHILKSIKYKCYYLVYDSKLK